MTAEAFRDWLRRHGYTAVSFARTCGISPKTVRKWYYGERGCPVLLPVVLRLLDKLGDER